MSNNLRKYAKQTNTRLVLGFILILLFLGDGLICFIYGTGAAVMGLICIIGGLVLLLIIWLVLLLIDWIVKRANE